MYKKFNRNMRRMQGGGQPVQQGAPQMVPAPQQQSQPSAMERAMGVIIEQNERLKQQVQMSQIQMQKMQMMMEGKTPPSEARTMPGGAKNTPKKRGGAIKKRKKY
tara:strand:- start:2114 stop:2428 length:315 start_codon:yes stop_codon:yes gene_type:complete